MRSRGPEGGPGIGASPTRAGIELGRQTPRPLADLVEEVHRQVAHVSGGVAALRSRLSALELTRDVARRELPGLFPVLQEIRACLEETARRLEPTLLQPPGPSGPTRGLAALSPRQRHVLEEVVAGKTNKEIAFDIGVSEKTVETHRARVMAKLHARSLAQLVRIFLGYEMQPDEEGIRRHSIPGRFTPG